MLKVLVARAVPPELLQRLQPWFEVDVNEADELLDKAALIRRLHGKAGVITTGSERIDAEVLDANPQLRAVCNMAVGFNNLDVDACTARGVLCSNTPDVLTETTADFGFALLLAAARRLAEGERYLREGRWTQWSYELMLGAEVHGTTLGVFGMGRIGQAIARRAHHGFGMRVIYFNRTRLSPEVEAALGARHVDKATLLCEADHLVIVAPYTPQTHHAIGAAELARMKPGATLVNIARGGVVDDGALATALRDGRLGAAGLDVFEGEPALNPALLACPNAVLTPHIASASAATRRAMFELACDNLVAALGCGPQAGRPPTPLNPQVLPLAPAAG